MSKSEETSSRRIQKAIFAESESSFPGSEISFTGNEKVPSAMKTENLGGQGPHLHQTLSQ